jgi:transcriptional regulator with XRE-family HTH domain
MANKKLTLKDYLKAADLNGAQLGRRIGVERAVISRWATGKSIPRPNNVKKMAEVMNVSYYELLHIFYK